jgi:hypothetical protein
MGLPANFLYLSDTRQRALLERSKARGLSAQPAI